MTNADANQQQLSESDAAYRIQFRMMLRSTWIFLPITMLNVMLIGASCFGIVTWQEAFALSSIVVLACYFAGLQSAVRSEIQTHGPVENSKWAQHVVEQAANTDFLTGVATRRALLSSVEDLCRERAKTKKPFALGVIDLDGFKPLNDFFGHAAGDQVLIEVARRLSAHVGGAGVVARLGADEFALLIFDCENRDAVLAQGQAAILAMSAPIEIDGQVTQLSASFGFALYPEAGTTAATLLEHADEALRAVKGERRSASAIYDAQNATTVLRGATIQQRLRRALGTDHIYLEFQPIVCLDTGHVISYEALARWTDYELGQVSPAEFIPAAESCGVMGELTRHLLRQALAVAATWPPHVGVSFNVSRTSFADNTLAFVIIGCLDAAGVSPSRLTIEITGSAFASDHDRMCEVLDLLRHVGIRVAMDDIGVGCSTFSKLDRLPVDILKLDCRFIADVSCDTRRQHIGAGIVEMCNKLDITCVAEGIEHAAQLDFISKIGCSAAQGYLLGKPARSADLTHEIRAVA